MGYTCVDKSIVMDYTCYANGVLSVDTTAMRSPLTQLTLPVFCISQAVPGSDPTHRCKSISHAKNNHKPRFIVRGGFRKGVGTKRRLFLAGHLCKAARKTDA